MNEDFILFLINKYVDNLSSVGATYEELEFLCKNLSLEQLEKLDIQTLKHIAYYLFGYSSLVYKYKELSDYLLSLNFEAYIYNDYYYLECDYLNKIM